MRRIAPITMVLVLALAATASARRAPPPSLRAVTPAGTVLGPHGTPLVSFARRREPPPETVAVVLDDGMRATARLEWLVDGLGRVVLDGEWPPGRLRVETVPAATYAIEVREPSAAALPAPAVVRAIDRRPGLLEVVLDQPMPIRVSVVLARSPVRSAWMHVHAHDARFGLDVPRRSVAEPETWSFAYADARGDVSEWSAPIAARR